MATCVEAFKGAIKDFMTGQDADAFLKEVEARTEAITRKRLEPKSQALRKSVDDLIKENKIRMKRKRIEYKYNVLKRRAAEEQVEVFKNDYSEGLASFFTGTEVRKAQSRLSVAGNMKTRHIDILGLLRNRLDDKGVLKIFNNKKMDYKIAMERAGIDSGDENAKKAAEAVNETYDYIRKLFNLNGVYIPNAENYIAKLTHNSERLLSPTGNWISDIELRTRLMSKHLDFDKADKIYREKAFQRWYQSIRPLTDEEKTFETVAPGKEDKFFRSMYDSITTGIRKDLPLESGSVQLRTLRKSYNLADKFQAERVWYPKDPHSWYKYNKDYGFGSFHDAVINQVERSAEAIAIIEKMGTNPKNFADNLIRKYEPIIRRDQRKPGHLRRLRTIKNYINYILADPTIPGHGIGSKIVSSVKTLQYFRLGSVVIRSIPDLSYMSAAMRPYGSSTLETTFTTIHNVLRGLPKGELVNVAKEMRVYTDGTLGSMFDRWGNPDLSYGIATKGLQLQDVLSLINAWDNGGRTGMSFNIGSKLAKEVGKERSAIKASMRNILDRYGIDDDIWDLINKHKDKLTRANKNNFLTPDIVYNFTNEDIAKGFYKNKTGVTSDFKFQQAQEAIRNRLMNLFQDQMNYGKVFPNSSDWALIKAKSSTNPFLAGLWNVLTVFRSFDVSAMRRTWGSFLYSEDVGSIWKNLNMRKADVAKFLINNIIWGNLSFTAGELIHGRIPNYKDPRTWVESAILGGAFGVYGGFIENFLHDQNNTDILKSLAGPVIGSLSDIGNLIAGLFQGKNIKNQLVNFLYYHLPMANLFYLKPLLDKTLFVGMHNMVDPRYMTKYRERQRTNARNSGEHLLWLP